MNTEDKLKLNIQTVMLSISVSLLVLKFAAFFITNSVGILTDAMESIVNVVAGSITLYAIYYAAKPRDTRHPFGHGKFELISASIEGIMVCMAGVIIIYEGIKRLFITSDIEKLDIGIWIVAISGIINYIAGWYSVKVGKKKNSIALVAGGRHLQSDTYSSIGLVAGLILLYYTKIQWIDSALALVFGVIIILSGCHILKKTVNNLMDGTDDEMLKKLVKALQDANPREDWIDIHNVKIVCYGKLISIDCDLTLPWFDTIKKGHESYEALRDYLRSVLDHELILSIHFDPCREKHCAHCAVKECLYRKEPHTQKQSFTISTIVKEESLK